MSLHPDKRWNPASGRVALARTARPEAALHLTPTASLFAVLASLSGLLGGCATPGPNHVYTAAAGAPEVIRDAGPDATVEVPSFATADDKVSGLAYDPYTDHLFLRLAPGNRIRVVDRPDRKIKREFTVPELDATGGGDLAVRPRDGHIFFACPGERFVIETDRFGKFLRRLELAGLNDDAAGLAYDAAGNRLFVAVNGTPAGLRTYDLAGKLLQTVAWALGPVRSLAYDAASHEIYAVVPGESAVIVLSEEGKVLRKLPAGEAAEFVDLGQRSFVRVF